MLFFDGSHSAINNELSQIEHNKYQRKDASSDKVHDYDYLLIVQVVEIDRNKSV
jgi:hypothetical protein